MFENDGAGDFFARLGTAGAGQRTEVIRHAVQAAADAAGYLEVDEGQAAIAAAAVVAAAGAGQPVTAADNGRTIEPDGLPARTRSAGPGRALDRVADSDSEWYELWRRHAALGALAEVRAALTLTTGCLGGGSHAHKADLATAASSDRHATRPVIPDADELIADYFLSLLPADSGIGAHRLSVPACSGNGRGRIANLRGERINVWQRYRVVGPGSILVVIRDFPKRLATQ